MNLVSNSTSAPYFNLGRLPVFDVVEPNSALDLLIHHIAVTVE